MTDALKRAMVSLAIIGDDLNPQEITGLLAGEPRRGVRKGEAFIGHNGQQRSARSGMWLFGGECWEDAPAIGSHIKTLLGRLTEDLDVWRTVTGRFECYVNVGGYFHDWTGGLSLEADVLRLLAERGLHIDFDLYAPAASEAEETP
jgi:Domain of unknown function (DUF4279)